MRDKILEAIKTYDMLSPGDHLAVGLSGGADSVALLHALISLSAELDLTLTALHLNHQLRGAESNRDEAFVRRLCWDWHIRLIAKSAPVAELMRESGLSMEAAAREARYDFFQRSAASGKVATAHTLSDSAETVLLNMARGTALRGLTGIPPVRGRIIRPLILATRQDVETYCRQHNLDYVTDSSNLDDKIARNRLRHDVTPVLSALNPGWLGCVAGMTEALREDADYLDELAAALLERAKRAANLYDRALILSEPKPLLMRAILLALKERGVPVERKRLEQVRDALLAGTGGVQLSAKWICRVAGEDLLFVSSSVGSPIIFPPTPITEPFEDRIIPIRPGKTLHTRVVSREVLSQSSNYPDMWFQNALDCDKIGRLVTLRQREPGDRIRIAGRGLTKTLRKLMNEQAIPPGQRDESLLLTNEGGVLWVEGFGVAEAAAVTQDTKRVLLITVSGQYMGEETHAAGYRGDPDQ